MNKPLSFLIAADFPPAQTLDWYRFHLLLQQLLNSPIKLHLARNFSAFHSQHRQQPDLIYCGAYDAAALMREQHYLPLLRPASLSDEVVILAAGNSPIRGIGDLRPGQSVICLSDFDVETVGLILLEPADIGKGDVRWHSVDTYQAVLRLLRGNPQAVGIMRLQVYRQLSPALRRGYRPIVASAMSVFFHSLLLAPALTEKRAAIAAAIMQSNQRSDILDNLGIKGFKPLDDAIANFICDVIDTLC